VRPRLLILRTPAGAAPEPVRQARVGLELPVSAAGEFTLQSVLDPEAPRSQVAQWWWRLTGRLKRDRGYAVFVVDAREVLERRHPTEAAWWRQHAPHLCVPGRVFAFDRACGALRP